MIDNSTFQTSLHNLGMLPWEEDSTIHFSLSRYYHVLIPVLLGLTICSLRPKSYSAGNRLIHAPAFGPKNWLARWKFFRNAREYIQDGYDQAKDSIFKVSGDDIVVLPQKYVDELRNLPDNIVSSIQANIDNFEGLHSTTSLLLEGNLHTRTIQKKLTPKLATLVDGSLEKLDEILPQEIKIEGGMPTRVPAFHLILRLVSHISARHFVGFPTCENEKWLSTALQYTENAFKTIIFLRIFPDWLKPIVGPFVPWGWQVRYALWKAKRIIVPVIEERRRQEAVSLSEGSAGGGKEGDSSSYQKPNDFLQMMIDSAVGDEGRPDKLAHRLLILTLASVHTTSMAATQTLFDLCVRPEYIDILREEVVEVLGGADSRIKKTTLTHMRKMDSFMRESQRLSPPSLLGFKRATRQAITLSDGLELPAHAHLMMPVYPIVTDAAVVGGDGSPLAFDGLRHWRARQQPGQQNRHQFATTSSTNLHFGHGRFACPGRFFAANNIKMVLATLLMRYDFGFADDDNKDDNNKKDGGEDGKMQERVASVDRVRPKDVCLHEYVFPNPWAEVRFTPRPSS